ncbi:hypothetical protein DRE_02740 [Drechslerella stenobrocha 248]|uniref:RING-type E3 ubiquitin transferase n=1 Tax=Drechslerella stenobrocha 248 TaxID=1043628 RepID=W7I6K9_9PEZI|nr:hypothetical protein DRE_02740 [Drechslerella stenobrocha 248]
MRLTAYGAVSTLVASGVVLQAFHQRANFYSACVHLAQSNACLMILTNFGFFMTVMFGKMVQKIFYGPLRPAEVEHLYEKAWYAITETCLAMTIFRDEFHSGFVAMFTVLLFLKCFHWLGSDRVDFMEQTPPAHPYIFHARLSSSLLILLIIDFFLTRYCVLSLMQMPKPNMLVMFAFEFAILTLSCFCVVGRYSIAIIEKVITTRKTKQLRERKKRVLQRRVERGLITEEEMRDTILEDEETGDIIGAWESKSAWLFNLEITTDLIKLVIYLVFFAIVLIFYGLPLHIVRDVYITIRSFISRIRDYIAYKKATAHMNSRYPDATREEIAREAVCIICREEMIAWNDTPGDNAQSGQAPSVDEEIEIIDERFRPKKLPCGHVLHLACMKSWMERQQRCPTCRRPVLDEPRNPQPQANPAQPGPQANGIRLPNVDIAGQPQVPPAPGGQPGQAHAPDPRQQPLQPQALQQQQPLGQPQQPQQPLGQQPQGQPQGQQPGGPQGFRLNVFVPEGGFVQALARNLAQRQQQGAQQDLGPDAQQINPQGLHQAQQAAPQQAAQQTVHHDITTQLHGNTAAVAQLAVQESLQQQQLWNQRIMHQMQAILDEVIALRNSLPASSGSNVESRTAPGQTAGSPPSSLGSAPSAAHRALNQTAPGALLRHTVRPPAGPPAEAEADNVAAGPSSSQGTTTPPAPHSNSDARGAPVDNARSTHHPFPPGFQLPPGWSLVPLYPVAQSGAAGGVGGARSGPFATPQHQTAVYSTPSPLHHHHHQHQHHQLHHHHHAAATSAASSFVNNLAASPDLSDISLSSSGIRRRGVQRQYSNNLHTYHSMASPRREEQNPFAPSASTSTPQDQASIATDATGSGISLVASGTSGTANNQNQTAAYNLSSSSRQMTSTNNQHQPASASSPSRHGSLSSTSREVLERRHRDAHSPRPRSNISPARSIRSQPSSSSNNNPNQVPAIGRGTEFLDHQTSISMGIATNSSPGSERRSDAPTLDTSAEHNHPVDATHDPTQGRSLIEEHRRASAGEILLSETDTIWPIPSAIVAGSNPDSDGSLSPTPSLPGSRVGSIRRNRRSSNAALTAPPGNGSPIGTTGMFNVIPKSQASSTVGSPIMGHSGAILGRFDIGSPSRMSLDKGKEKDDGSAPTSLDERGRGRSRSKEGDEKK